ncbi:patatin-like phospholipase family protein [Bradyrhizobium erythrophlei]|uniref:patatin-like phospholipase family protein n=1 Tax=Bradyrhizobium erythrophlei TaxID=1437360 RepID=UPI0035E49D2A
MYQVLLGVLIIFTAALVAQTSGLYRTILLAAIGLTAGVVYQALMRSDSTTTGPFRRLAIRCAIAARRLLRKARSLIGEYLFPKFTPHFNQPREWQFRAVRLLFGAIGMIALLQFGASAWFWVPWVWAFLALHAKFQRLIQDSTEDGYRGMPHWLLATWIGAICTLLFLLFLANAFDQRVEVEPDSRLRSFENIAVFTIAALSSLAVSTTFWSLRDRSIPWVTLFVGLTVVAFGIAWTLACLSVTYVKPIFNGMPSDANLEAARKAELMKRAEWSKQPGWQTGDHRPLTIAVALSGGGYRAAMIHAGVLAALDEKCVPIRYLATVSGGSIIGAYYGLGYTPRLFKERLQRQQPGLPDEVLSNWRQIGNWSGQSISGETYASFFSRAFFGNKVLADTTTSPQLLVNASDLERPSNAREVFFKGRSAAFPQLDNTRIADIVAASGAFPGVFQPKNIAWPADDSGSGVTDRRLVDGGVVENLGYTGLEKFLNITERSDLAPKPDYLIISDASAEVVSGALPNTVSVWELLTRSQDIAYAFQDRLIHSLLSGEGPHGPLPKPLFVRAQEPDLSEALQTEWFPSTTVAEKIVGTKIAEEVTHYSTLLELSHDQVEKAFWLGHAIGAIRWHQIDQWRKSFTRSPACQD